ncbi:glycosyltransferase family 25 protein [Pandoraea terrigena]|nr:glycosyltransferase family 25 protein [Pandoraea terrigena]
MLSLSSSTEIDRGMRSGSSRAPCRGPRSDWLGKRRFAEVKHGRVTRAKVAMRGDLAQERCVVQFCIAQRLQAGGYFGYECPAANVVGEHSKYREKHNNWVFHSLSCRFSVRGAGVAPSRHERIAMTQNPVSAPKLPPVVVISLVDSDVRRAHMIKQLAAADVRFQFFDAERIREYPPTYDASERLRIYGNHLTLGEVGCYESHYRIWEALANSNDDIWCILEDDVELTPDFSRCLASTLGVAVPWGIMRLKEGGAAGQWQVGRLPGGEVLNDHRKQPGGAHAYLIRRGAALVLLAYARRIIHPVDDMINRNWEHGISMISISPDIVLDRGDDLGTTIPGRHKVRRNAWQKLKREFHRGRDSLSRHVDAWRRRWLTPVRG